MDRDKIQFDFIIDHPNETELKNEVEFFGGKVYVLPTFRGSNIFEIKNAWNSFFEEHQEYKIFHTHSRSYASVYLPIAKTHGVITISHAHSTSNGKGLLAFIKNIMQYPLRKQSDFMFACSKEAGRWLYGEKAISGEHFRIIPNAIDAPKFKYNEVRRNEIRNEIGIGDEFVVGHVGRLVLPKNHDFLLKCFAEFNKRRPASKLVLIGDGDLRTQLESEAKKLRIFDSVIFLGSRLNNYDYYQAMDCFVFPSLWEGLGMAVIEAEAAGLPCLVSDTVPRSVDVGAGLVQFCSLKKTPVEWAENIHAIERKDSSAFIINAGYDIDANARQLQLFYEGIGK